MAQAQQHHALKQGLVESLEGAMAMNRTNLNAVVKFLQPREDKFQLEETLSFVKRMDAQSLHTLVNVVLAHRGAVGPDVLPPELLQSFITALRLHQLQVVVRSVSAPQILALHRGIPEGTTREQGVQLLAMIQRILQSQPLANLRNVHQLYREAGPEDLSQLARMLSVGPEGFMAIPAIRQILALDADEVKSLRETLSSFSAFHLAMLVDLLRLENFDALEIRSHFVPRILEEPEGFMGGGFALDRMKMSGEDVLNKPLGSDEDVNDDDADDAVWGNLPVRLEITEQPPPRCVYRRNMRPPPEVRVKGADGGNPNLRVRAVLVRCDTMVVLDEAAMTGELEYPVAAENVVSFDKLRIMQTSHQLQDTHFTLRFELREAKAGVREVQVVHSVQSSPFMVVSHSTQINKPQTQAPVVSELVPSMGNVRGGTRVVLLGENFMDTPSLRVRFDSMDVQPTFHGPRTLVCATPPHSTAGAVCVSVCNDGKRWGQQQELFNYVVEPDPHPPNQPPPERRFFSLNQSIADVPLETDGTDLTFFLNSRDALVTSLGAFPANEFM